MSLRYGLALFLLATGCGKELHKEQVAAGEGGAGALEFYVKEDVGSLVQLDGSSRIEVFERVFLRAAAARRVLTRDQFAGYVDAVASLVDISCDRVCSIKMKRDE